MKNELYGGGLMSAHHTGRPVENGKSCGEIRVPRRRKGKGEKLEGWKLKTIDETRYINWVGKEGLKFLAPSQKSSFD